MKRSDSNFSKSGCARPHRCERWEPRGRHRREGTATTCRTVEFGDDDARHTGQRVEGCSDRAGGLTDLCVDDQPAVSGTGQAGDPLEFLDEFFVQLVTTCGVNNDQIGRCACL